MRKRALLWAGLMIAGFATACEGDSDKSSTAGTTVPLAEVPPKLAAVMCSVVENCYGPIFSLFSVDCPAVTEQRILNGTFPLLQGKIDQGTVHYDGTLVAACLASYAARTCADLLDRDSPECLAAIDGTVELGGACDLDDECKGMARCRSSNGTCPGECASLLAAGQACAKDSDCQSGLQCSVETKLCVHPAAVDEQCEYGAPPCGPGLLCLGKDDANRVSGTCSSAIQALAAAEDAACDPVAGQLCQSGLSCIADSYTTAVVWKCVKTGSYAAGAACKPGFPDACVAGDYCRTGTGAQALNGTCTAIPAAGEPCATGLGTQCGPNAACVNGTCQNLAANGVSCTGDAMCYSEKCGSQGCEPNLPCE